MIMNAQTQHSEPPAGVSHRSTDDPLLESLAILTRLHGRSVSPQALAAGLPLKAHRMTPELIIRAADREGYSARVGKRPLTKISKLLLPAILVLKDGGACVLTGVNGRKSEAEIILPESGFGSRTVPFKELKPLYIGYCIFVQPRPRPDARTDPAVEHRGKSWFWGTLIRFKRFYLEAAFATLLINVLTVATALFTRNVYDRVVPNNALDTLVVLASGTLVAIAFEFVARNLRAYYLDHAGKKADVVLASRLFAQALGLRMEVSPASPGAFASELREFESLRDFITSATLTAFSDLPFTFFFIWVVFLIGGDLYLVPLLAIPVVLLVGLLAQFPLSFLIRQHMRESILRHGLLVECVEGLESLKTLSAEGAMQGRWEHYTALTGETGARSRFVSSIVVNVSLLVQQCTTVAMVVWGVYLIHDGVLTMGGLIACVILTGRALGPLGQVAGLLTRYQQARIAYFMLNGLMKKPLERPQGRRFLHRPALEGSFGFDNVSFAYPGQKLAALSSVSFAVRAGEHVAILGRIGSGKSTLLKLMVGLYRPGQGSIVVDGADIEQFDPADLRGNIGYVAQDAKLFHGTLRDNVVMGAPLAADEDVLDAARMAGLDKLIEHHPMGFDLLIAEGGGGLSGGQRQTVAIARALVKKPQVLLLDEPTSAMDHSSEQVIISNLKEFSRARTMVIVTHKPTMLTLVDRIIVLDRGRVVLDGARDDVLKQLMRQV